MVYVGIVSGLDFLDEEWRFWKLTELTLDSSALLYTQAKRFSVKFLLVIGIASPLEETFQTMPVDAWRPF